MVCVICIVLPCLTTKATFQLSQFPSPLCQQLIAETAEFQAKVRGPGAFTPKVVWAKNLIRAYFGWFASTRCVTTDQDQVTLPKIWWCDLYYFFEPFCREVHEAGAGGISLTRLEYTDFIFYYFCAKAVVHF